MTYKLVYGAVREHPRKVIHVVRLLDELLDTEELDEIAEHVRERALTKDGEQDAAVVVVQGDSKETLRLFGEPYAVTRVRAAMFNAAIRWRSMTLD
jgi:tetrahydromethanopterin S-methyltransferase subunit A